jgi:hypothetical protein
MMTDQPFGPPSLAEYVAARNADDPNADYTGFVQYEPYTGEVIATGRCSVPAFEHMAAGAGAYLKTEEMHDWSKVYVDLATSEVKAKEPNPAQRSGMVLSNLPLDGVLTISSRADPFPRHFDISAPEMTLAFEHPGTYRVVVKSVCYLEAVFEVQA